MAAVEFRVLGPLEVRRDGEPVVISAPKQRALLGLLLLHASRPVAQDELIDQLWGEDAPLTARASLQNHVHALRKLLGAEVLERQAAGYVVHVEPGQLDLARFEGLLAEARQAEPRERAAKLREALSCWRGPALVELHGEPFARREIGRLEEERLAALEDRIDAELELGRSSDLVVELEALVDAYPLRERFWEQLMLTLYRTGRQADALAAYQRAHTAFAEEIGVEPAVGMRELHRAILLQDPALDEGSPGVGSMLERAAAILPKPAREQAASLYEYAVALLRTGERRRAVSTLAAAERLAAAAGEPGLEERARLYGSYVAIWTDAKSPLAHLADAERAARRLEELGDVEGLWLAHSQRAQMLHMSGRPDSALELVERCAELGVETGNRWWQARARGWMALGLADGTTPVSDAIAWCEDELDAARADVANSAGVLAALVVLYAEVGRIVDSRALGETALREARAAGLLWVLLAVMEYQAAAEIATGNFGEAIAHLRALRAINEAEDDRAGGPIAAAELALVLALAGEIDESRELAVSARAAASPDLFATEVLWRRTLALVAAHHGRMDEALRLSDEARARTAASDRLTFHAQTLEDAATIREISGDSVGAVEMLGDALLTYERKESIVGAERVRGRMREEPHTGFETLL